MINAFTVFHNRFHTYHVQKFINDIEILKRKKLKQPAIYYYDIKHDIVYISLI